MSNFKSIMKFDQMLKTMENEITKAPKGNIFFNGRECKIWPHENLQYGREECIREDYGCTGAYFYSFYDERDFLKDQKIQEDMINKIQENAKKMMDFVSMLDENERAKLAQMEQMWSQTLQRTQQTQLVNNSDSDDSYSTSSTHSNSNSPVSFQFPSYSDVVKQNC